jgi:hypothetical protein
MIASLLKRSCGVLAVGLAACGGHPVQMGIYTPVPDHIVMAEIQEKVVSLGYTIERLDTINRQIVAQRILDKPVNGADREEIAIQIGKDVTGSTKLTVTTSRVFPATGDRPIKRAAASAKTNADANQLIYLYMKNRRT